MYINETSNYYFAFVGFLSQENIRETLPEIENQILKMKIFICPFHFIALRPTKTSKNIDINN